MSGSVVIEDETDVDRQITTHYAWNVILYNDNFHSMEYIIRLIVECVKVSHEEAERMTMTIHNSGREIIFSGGQEPAEDIYETILHYPEEERFSKKLPKVQVELVG